MKPISLVGARILVVEDEPFIAFDLKMAIEDAGAVAIGPAATIAEALELIAADFPQGAILDVNLPDGTIAPVLAALAGRASIAVHTGVGLPQEIRVLHPDVRVFTKPTDPTVLIDHVRAHLEA